MKLYLVNVYRKLRRLSREMRGRVLLARATRNKDATSGDWVALLVLGRFGPARNVAAALKERGYRIHVLSPEFPVSEAPFATSWQKIENIEDTDDLSRFDDALAHLRALEVKGVLIESKNLLLKTQTYLAGQLGLPKVGEQASLTSNSKIALRRSLDAKGLPNVPWEVFTDIRSVRISFPAVIKPDRGTASKGVRFLPSARALENQAEYEAALEEDISIGHEFLLEGYVKGRQFDMEGVAQDGEYFCLSCVEEHYEGKPPHFPPAWHYFNPPIDDGLKADLESAMKAALDAFGVRDGAFHVEMRVAEDGTVYPLDYANRMGYNRVISLASGVSFSGSYADMMLGRTTIADIALRPRPVLNLFFSEQDQLRAGQRFNEKHPQNVFRFSTAPFEFGHTLFHGRITLFDDTDALMMEKLTECDLVPPEFAGFYPGLFAA